MAFRYRQITPQTGDFINPNDWNVNVREFTNEFNGHLDRDNLPEKGIGTASIKANAFHEVFSSSEISEFTLEDDESRFTQLQIIEFETHQQGILMCEWSGHWEFEKPQEDLTDPILQRLDFRIRVNGFGVCNLMGELNYKAKSNGYMVGAIPIESGMVRVEVEVKTTGEVNDDLKTIGDLGFTLLNQPDGRIFIRERELIAVLRKA